MNNAEVGSRIRSKRKEVKLNQKALADLLAISQPEMSNIEKGKRQLTDARVQQVAAALKCDVAYLTTGGATATTTTAPAVGVA